MNKLISAILLMTFFTMACSNNQEPAGHHDEIKKIDEKDFSYDVTFMQQYDSVVLLTNEGEDAQVLVSPKYQAKVLTSTATGPNGKSFGWINYKAFTAPVDAHMNGFGGENRFWLGPEGGKFSLFFAKGDKMNIDSWKTPAPFDTEAWSIIDRTDNSVLMQKDMKLFNYSGTELTLTAKRSITLLPRQEIAEKIGLALSDSINSVGYLAANSIKNTGNFEWNEATGMPCIWMLDMFSPSDRTVIVIPYKKEVKDASLPVATTNYFGEIPKERISYKDGVLLFRADGKNRGKLGIGPVRAKPIAGSFDAESLVLTITLFDTDPAGKYLNQEWTTEKPALSGDAVNAYNDGPLTDGSQMGPFYEIESVSPAAFLKPGSVLTHNHYVFHFTGAKHALDAIARKLLGISLAEIETAF